MFIFWLLLSGETVHAILHGKTDSTSIIFIISAVVSSLIVAYFSHDLLIGKSARFGPGIYRTLKFIKYLPWLMWQIIIANFDLVYRTLHPSMPIDPCMIEFDTELETELGITILANSITLTPGTVTVKADKKGHFIVHAIAKAPAESLIDGGGDMQARVRKLEE